MTTFFCRGSNRLCSKEAYMHFSSLEVKSLIAIVFVVKKLKHLVLRKLIKESYSQKNQTGIVVLVNNIDHYDTPFISTN